MKELVAYIAFEKRAELFALNFIHLTVEFGVFVCAVDSRYLLSIGLRAESNF
jgi:hypothetical protein